MERTLRLLAKQRFILKNLHYEAYTLSLIYKATTNDTALKAQPTTECILIVHISRSFESY